MGMREVPTKGDVEAMAKMRSEGLPMRMVCAVMGVSRSRVETWLARGEADLDAEIDSTYARLYIEMGRAEASMARECIAGMLDAAKADPRNWQAYAWLLERSFPEEFALARRADVGQKEGEVKVIMTGVREPVATVDATRGAVVHPPVKPRGKE